MSQIEAAYQCPRCKKAWDRIWDKKLLGAGRWTYRAICPKCEYRYVTPFALRDAGLPDQPGYGSW
jgi:transcriptional regulator NrdR family protein